MKVIGIGIGVALMLALGVASQADVVTFDVYEGWNLLSVPTVPINPDPYSVFANAPSGVDGNYFRWDGYGTQGADFGDASATGNVLLGDGMWLYCAAPGTISYDGLANGVPTDGVKTDMWISLPGNTLDSYTEPDPNGDPSKCGGGWTMIGTPFNEPICVNETDAQGNEISSGGERILFTDGIEMKTWSEAVAASWVASAMYGSSPVLGGTYDVGYDGFSSTTIMQPAMGYWINTYKDNLAMIILAKN